MNFSTRKNVYFAIISLFFIFHCAVVYAEWQSSSYNTRFKSSSVDSVCKAAIQHHSAYSLSLSDPGACPIADEFSHVSSSSNGPRWRSCYATRTIGPCERYPSSRSYQWRLAAFYTEDSDNNGENCKNNTQHPINIPTGNKFFKYADIDSPIPLFRYYNSLAAEWSFDYRQRIDFYEYGYTAMRPDGSGIVFRPNADGGYTAPSHRVERLIVGDNRFVLYLPKAVIETYNADGRLLSIQTPTGTTYVRYFDDAISVEYQGKSLVLTLDNKNRVVRADSSGQSVTYDYAFFGSITLLFKVTNGDHEQRLYYGDVNSPNMLTRIVDKNAIFSVEYDDQGRAISSEKGYLGSGIERTDIQYHNNGTRTVTNALGKQSTYHFTQYNGEYKITQIEGHPSANCAGANKEYTYDTNGFVASLTDWKGNVTTYNHNSRGQELSRTEASGTPQARTITTEWHHTLNLPIKITEPNRETLMTYDPQGRLLSRQVNRR